MKFDAEAVLAQVEGMSWQSRRFHIGKALRASDITQEQLNQLNPELLTRLIRAASRRPCWKPHPEETE